MFLSGEKIEGERCMSAGGSSVKGSNQQSSTSCPKVKGGGLLFSGCGPLITEGVGKRYYTRTRNGTGAGMDTIEDNGYLSLSLCSVYST